MYQRGALHHQEVFCWEQYDSNTEMNVKNNTKGLIAWENLTDLRTLIWPCLWSSEPIPAMKSRYLILSRNYCTCSDCRLATLGSVKWPLSEIHRDTAADWKYMFTQWRPSGILWDLVGAYFNQILGFSGTSVPSSKFNGYLNHAHTLYVAFIKLYLFRRLRRNLHETVCK